MATTGTLRDRPTFQRRAIDENGDPLGDWEEPGITVWAEVLPLKGGEPVMQQRLQGTTPVSVSIRYSSVTKAIDNAWRMVWRGVNFDIKDVSPDRRRVFISILATADQSDA
jgi:SPP1 family predicted phage head-tail adaptor